MNQESDPTRLPIACELNPDDLTARREGELAALRQRALQLTRIIDGVRLVLPGDRATLDAVARVIAAERECCRFLRFRLEIAPGLGDLTLEVDGPSGTATFLEDLGLTPEPRA